MSIYQVAEVAAKAFRYRRFQSSKSREDRTMKHLKHVLTAAAVAGMVLATGLASAQEMKFFRIGTGSAGGTYFPIGGLIANAISNPPGSRPCDKGGNCGVPGLVAIAQSTNASAHNVTAINAGQMEAGLTGAATLYFAYHGTAKFEGKKKPKLRVIANLFPEDLHLVLPKGKTLNSLKDLEGKRVGIAQAGSGTQIAVELMLAAQGITRDNIDEAELNNSQSAERIADGQLDAYFYAAGTPVAAMIQLDNTKGMDLYSFSEAEVMESNKAVPYYVPSTIDAGTYAGVAYDVNTLAVNGTLVTNADQPEDLIYEITKALWNDTTRKLLDTGHAKGKVIRLETALKGIAGLDVPLHPGAEKYYREVGVLK
jgi:TRAP transporter TAXI family solute receptor